ncbi:ATP-binding cassette domain-containing protein [Sphingobacterium sp. lm-10]|uniref:ABC transporter ATP-binding protein n=1 Tax=Sphingobacterium sp. lm-10 TaxID=2944904 RepID=UPI002021E68A|nr:ATP-binding cassette domain-containing protein [Sphingobacterium sp. lm-10]MCL7989271.1 ATP-binding cassette domain-containing protein [Sphingobacterium sp. lm-10]
MQNYVLKTEGLTFRYGSQSPMLAFKDLYVSKQQHTLLLGDSGTGKSTLLNLLGGLSNPTTGQVLINNDDIYQLSESALDKFRAQNIGFIFQEAHLLKNLTLSENIRLAQSLAGYPVDQKQIDSLLEQLQLAEHAQKHPNQLSRGQLQRAAIARAIINRPAILLADEPTASLDDNNTQRVLTLLKEMADKHGSTLIISTHDKRIKDEFTNTYFL